MIVIFEPLWNSLFWICHKQFLVKSVLLLSNSRKYDASLLLRIVLNWSISDCKFFNWLTSADDGTPPSILSRLDFLILSVSDLDQDWLIIEIIYSVRILLYGLSQRYYLPSCCMSSILSTRFNYLLRVFCNMGSYSCFTCSCSIFM